jgi:hypothetical protein
MTIYNADGTPFSPVGSLVQFDPGNPDYALFNSYDQDAIMIGGSPLEYYEVFINITSMDQLYLEARDKLWSPNPVQIYGYYDPIEPQNPSTAFGIDGPGDVMFECNRSAVQQAIGHMPKRGSKIQTPHLNEYWVIVDVRLAQFQLWGALHVQLICERFQENISDVKTDMPRPDFTIF